MTMTLALPSLTPRLPKVVDHGEYFHVHAARPYYAHKRDLDHLTHAALAAVAVPAAPVVAVPLAEGGSVNTDAEDAQKRSLDRYTEASGSVTDTKTQNQAERARLEHQMLFEHARDAQPLKSFARGGKVVEHHNDAPGVPATVGDGQPQIASWTDADDTVHREAVLPPAGPTVSTSEMEGVPGAQTQAWKDAAQEGLNSLANGEARLNPAAPQPVPAVDAADEEVPKRTAPSMSDSGPATTDAQPRVEEMPGYGLYAPEAHLTPVGDSLDTFTGDSGKTYRRMGDGTFVPLDHAEEAKPAPPTTPAAPEPAKPPEQDKALASVINANAPTTGKRPSPHRGGTGTAAPSTAIPVSLEQAKIDAYAASLPRTAETDAEGKPILDADGKPVFGELTEDSRVKLASAMLRSSDKALQTQGQYALDTIHQQRAAQVSARAVEDAAKQETVLRDHIYQLAENDRVKRANEIAHWQNIFDEQKTKLDTPIDPEGGYYSGARGVLRSILNPIAAAVSGFGAGLVHQQSNFLPMVNQKIDQYINAQSKTRDNQLKVMQLALDRGNTSTTAYQLQSADLKNQLAYGIDAIASKNLPPQVQATYKNLAIKLRQEAVAQMQTAVTTQLDTASKPTRDALGQQLTAAQIMKEKAQAYEAYGKGAEAYGKAGVAGRGTKPAITSLAQLPRDPATGGFVVTPEEYAGLPPAVKATLVPIGNSGNVFGEDANPKSADSRRTLLQAAGAMDDWFKRIDDYQQKHAKDFGGPRTLPWTPTDAESNSLYRQAIDLVNNTAARMPKETATSLKERILPQIGPPGSWRQDNFNAKIGELKNVVADLKLAQRRGLVGIKQPAAITEN